MRRVEVLETPRLWLRPLMLEDAVQVQRLFPRWETVRLLASVVPWPYPEDGAEQYYRNAALPAMERCEEWHWTLRLKTAPDQIIGAVALATGEVNRGFWIAREWEGQGLMSEAADSITHYWFEVLGFERLRVPKAVANEASRRISLRQGMRVVELTEKEYVSGRLPTEVWEITAAEWRARRGRVQG